MNDFTQPKGYTGPYTKKQADDLLNECEEIEAGGHTRECLENFRAWQKACREYRAKWPNHCQVCAGWGGTWDEYDPSPPGVALSPGYMVDFTPCPNCVEKGFCPRCGEKILDEQDEIPELCPICGFSFEGETDGSPDSPECFCY